MSKKPTIGTHFTEISKLQISCLPLYNTNFSLLSACLLIKITALSPLAPDLCLVLRQVYRSFTYLSFIILDVDVYCLLCRTSSLAADAEFLQTAFAFSTKSEPADRLFMCRQAVDTTSCRLSSFFTFRVCPLLSPVNHSYHNISLELGRVDR